MVVRLREVHTLRKLPRDVSNQTQDGENNGLEPKDGAAVEPGHYAVILIGHIGHGCHDTVDSDEEIPESHAAGDGKHVVLGPVVGNQSRLAQDS